MYRIDAQTGKTVPSTFAPSVRYPGRIICVNSDGSALVVLPDGTERPTGEPKTSDNWDSPWTIATPAGSYAIYQSPDQNGPGVCRTYRMVV